MKNNILNFLKEKIKKEEEISPILFIGEDNISLNIELSEIIEELFQDFGVPKHFLFKFEDDGEKFKIEQSREILEIVNKKSSFEFQIILIENISRFTIGASNSLLKAFEEPEKGNIIFLTNSGENDILETILSRVTISRINYQKKFLIDENISSMLENYFDYENSDLLAYLYENSKKFEKQNYINFIDNAIEFCKKDLKYRKILEDFLELKNLNKKNNFNLKFGIDKILLGNK